MRQETLEAYNKLLDLIEEFIDEELLHEATLLELNEIKNN